MKHYKKLLLKKLSEDGWDLVSQNTDTDWWLEEYWAIRSNRANWGLELFILFLVDPLYEGHKKSQGVWDIIATSDIPAHRAVVVNKLAEMTVIGDFEQHVVEFLETLNSHRIK